MTVVVDAGPLYSLVDRRDPSIDSVRELLEREPGYLLVSAFVVTEADYLIRTRLGIEAELQFLRDLTSGAFSVECLTEAEIDEAGDVIRRYRELNLGLADASMVILARKFGTRRLLTFDERDFRAVRPLQGGSFTLLPADA